MVTAVPCGPQSTWMISLSRLDTHSPMPLVAKASGGARPGGAAGIQWPPSCTSTRKRPSADHAHSRASAGRG